MTDCTLALSEPEIARYRTMTARARVEEADAWRTAGIVPGARVADVGCGPGATLVVVAEVVAPDGSVTGVDGDPSAVAAAREMIARSGVANDTARPGTAGATGLPRGSFDVVVVRHVLAHNGGRVAEGVASTEDVAEWEAALERLDAAVERPVLVVPTSSAIGRRPVEGSSC